MVRVCKMRHYNIYSNMNNGYIVHNTKKPFEDGHTHINNFKTAKYVAYLSLYKKIPKNHHLSDYLYESVIRISDDRKYTAQIKELREKDQKKRKGK